MRRTASRLLGLLCLLTWCIPAWSQSVAEPIAAGGMTPIVGANSIAKSPVLDYYAAGDDLPLFPPGGGIMTDPPGQAYYPLRGRSWVQVDYLLWWVQGQNLPPLATTPAGGVVFGQERIDGDAQSGLRLRGGHFLDCDGLSGLMFDVWGLESGGDRVGVVSPVSGALRMPFTDMDLSLPSNQTPDGCGCLDDLVGTPSSVPIDSISTTSDTDVWSGGLYYRGRLCSRFDCCASTCDCRPGSGLGRHGHRLDGIFGYRYFSLDESLTVDGVLVPEAGTIVAQDRFATENDFHGVDMGLVYEVDRGRWSLEAIGRLALGINRQELSIAGAGNQNGGIFAQYTNIGTYDHDAFTAIPQGDLILAYAVTPRLRARVGYSWLLLSNVIRPATQIDTRLDGRFVDGTATRPLADPLAFFPRPRFETESVWIHGLSFGFDYTF
jgi:hypothetical protein